MANPAGCKLTYLARSAFRLALTLYAPVSQLADFEEQICRTRPTSQPKMRALESGVQIAGIQDERLTLGFQEGRQPSFWDTEKRAQHATAV